MSTPNPQEHHHLMKTPTAKQMTTATVAVGIASAISLIAAVTFGDFDSMVCRFFTGVAITGIFLVLGMSMAAAFIADEEAYERRRASRGH